MGVYLCYIIPKDITYTPSADEVNRIDKLLEKYDISQGHFEHNYYKRIRPIINPYGVSDVICPRCSGIISQYWVYDIIGEIYDNTDSDNEGIDLSDLTKMRHAPCCHNDISLIDIDYGNALRFCTYNAECDETYYLPPLNNDLLKKINEHSVEYIGFPAEFFHAKL